MDKAIFIWWWIFLLAALAVTIVDVYLLLRVVSLCPQIRTLTAETLPAAAGIAQNTREGGAYGRTVPLIVSLAKKSQGAETLTAALSKKLLR